MKVYVVMRWDAYQDADVIVSIWRDQEKAKNVAQELGHSTRYYEWDVQE